VTLPAFAAERRAAAPLLPWRLLYGASAAGAPCSDRSIDISCPRDAQRQTRRMLINGTDRQADVHPTVA